jgi:BMFP domain-containing protein YqiC
MREPPWFQELNARMRELLAQSPAKDVEKNMRAMLAGFFDKLELVTREEFDIQAKLLARTREKLDALEARVAELESKSRQP